MYIWVYKHKNINEFTNTHNHVQVHTDLNTYIHSETDFLGRCLCVHLYMQRLIES